MTTLTKKKQRKRPKGPAKTIHLHSHSIIFIVNKHEYLIIKGEGWRHLGFVGVVGCVSAGIVGISIIWVVRRVRSISPQSFKNISVFENDRYIELVWGHLIVHQMLACLLPHV
jgi:hypothetical protein